jgi:hypothetical protein
MGGAKTRNENCRSFLIRTYTSSHSNRRIRASRTIIDEVGRNLAPDRLKDFWSFLNALAIHPDEDWQVPFELGEKYTALGLGDGNNSATL